VRIREGEKEGKDKSYPSLHVNCEALVVASSGEISSFFFLFPYKMPLYTIYHHSDLLQPTGTATSTKHRIAEMYSNLAKPTLDVLLYNYQLSRNVGAEGLIIITVLVQGSAYLLRALTPPFGQYAATEQQLEGEFRFTHSRLIENAEEVALYRGSWVEKNIVERAYFSLIKHVNRVYRIRIGHGMVEEGIIKWLWGSLGVSTLKCLGRGKGGGKGKDSGSWPAQVEIGEMGP